MNATAMNTTTESATERRAFTLIELVVVLAILAILSGVLVPRVGSQMKFSRDARRLADIETVREAVEQYYLDKGSFPPANTNSAFGGWDVSHDGDFIQILWDNGYLAETPRDPINDATYQYRYYVYPAGSYGCRGSGSFYVLGIRAFESEAFAAKNQSRFACHGRDWTREFAYVTGGGSVKP